MFTQHFNHYPIIIVLCPVYMVDMYWVCGGMASLPPPPLIPTQTLYHCMDAASFLRHKITKNNYELLQYWNH